MSRMGELFLDLEEEVIALRKLGHSRDSIISILTSRGFTVSTVEYIFGIIEGGKQ